MKRMFVLSMLVPFAMICSCQKQDSAAERQLAQRRAELDAREKALAEREKPRTNIRKTLDPAQVKAERDRRIQQLSPEVQALISRTPPDTSQEKAEKDRMMQERVVQTPPNLEELRREKMSRLAATPEAKFPEAAASPSPSPTPQ
jgi:hypothetical protein